MSNEQDGHALIGSLRVENGSGVVRMEESFTTDIDDLWSAITSPERLRRWVAEVDGDLSLGSEFGIGFTSGWEGRARIELCDSPNRLVVSTWDEPGNETVIEAVLSSEPGGTKLVVEERGLPLDEYAAHGSGWQAHIEDLGAYLRGVGPSDWTARWRELTPAYEELAVSQPSPSS